MSIEHQVAVIYAGNSGELDDIPIERVSEFEEKLLAHIENTKQTLLDRIHTTGVLSDETKTELSGVIKEFKRGFIA
jgi:F-type H+-transporting ATPase subunit alpha